MARAADTSVRRAPLATVYGGGGLYGIGYILGICEALEVAGAGLGRVPALGTSAGSWAAAALALRVPFLDALDLVGHEAPRIPDPRANRLRRVAADLFGDETRCATVRAVACAFPRLQRVVLSGAEHPVADLVAASSAVPGMLAPHRIDDVRYLDGGVRSMASIDLAPPADRLLVVLPLGGPMFGPAGRFLERGVARELDAWQRVAPGGEALLVRPTKEIAALGRRPDQLFDPDRARRCYELAYEQGVMLRDEWRTLAGGRQLRAPSRS